MQLGGLSGHPELLARLDVDGLEVAHRHMVLVVRVVDAAAGFQRQHGAHYSHQGGDNQAAHGITVFVVAHCLPLYEIQYCPGREMAGSCRAESCSRNARTWSDQKRGWANQWKNRGKAGSSQRRASHAQWAICR